MSSTVALHSVFVYGSLMADEVVSLLLNRLPQTTSAILPDFHRFKIKGRVYPAILPAESDKVSGKVLSEITDHELYILDEFEDVEYRRENVEVLLTDKTEKLQTKTYVWANKGDPDLYSTWGFELRKDFTSDAESAVASLRGLSATKSSGRADLTLLFRAAAVEAKVFRAQNRILRVILMYCRSSVRPTYDWPLTQKLFTLDVMYLHDKPSPDNYPQDVYDCLVDVVEHVSEYEGYIFETGLGHVRSVFKPMSILLSHPQQRCSQDDLDTPKSLAKKVPVTDATNAQDHHNGINIQTTTQ